MFPSPQTGATRLTSRSARNRSLFFSASNAVSGLPGWVGFFNVKPGLSLCGRALGRCAVHRTCIVHTLPPKSDRVTLCRQSAGVRLPRRINARVSERENGARLGSRSPLTTWLLWRTARLRGYGPHSSARSQFLPGPPPPPPVPAEAHARRVDGRGVLHTPQTLRQKAAIRAIRSGDSEMGRDDGQGGHDAEYEITQAAADAGCMSVLSSCGFRGKMGFLPAVSCSLSSERAGETASKCARGSGIAPVGADAHLETWGGTRAVVPWLGAEELRWHRPILKTAPDPRVFVQVWLRQLLCDDTVMGAIAADDGAAMYDGCAQECSESRKRVLCCRGSHLADVIACDSKWKALIVRSITLQLSPAALFCRPGSHYVARFPEDSALPSRGPRVRFWHRWHLSRAEHPTAAPRPLVAGGGSSSTIA